MSEKLKDSRLKDWKSIKAPSTNNLISYISAVDFICHCIQFNKFIDVGPGIAFSEAWEVRALKPACLILGFEPQPERFDILRNHFYPGQLFLGACGSKAGNYTGAMGHASGETNFKLSTSIENIETGLYKEETVQVYKVDDVIDLNHSQKLSAFVWADVDGSEFQVLKGMEASLQSHSISGFMVELSPEKKGVDSTYWEEVYVWAEKRGYCLAGVFNIQPTHFDCIFMSAHLLPEPASISLDIMRECLSSFSNEITYFLAPCFDDYYNDFVERRHTPDSPVRELVKQKKKKKQMESENV
jgi:FkbM family methyltransferase